MIKIYCQYSYGGYKTFFIDGLSNEPLGQDKEVTIGTSHGFPKSAQVFFQFGGSRLVYRKLNTGELALVVREIPSNDVDSSGRPLFCAVQFVGNVEDRAILDNLALKIANDITSFETFFADLFYVRQGLHIEGDKLRAYIEDHDSDFVVIGEKHPSFLSIGKKKDGVFLFVPLSEKFGKDTDVTPRVCNELMLTKEDLKESVIGPKEFSKLQNKLKIVVQTAGTDVSSTEHGSVVGKSVETENKIDVATNSDEKERLAALEKENKELKSQYRQDAEKWALQGNENFKALKALQGNLDKSIEENRRLSNQFKFYKRLSYGLAGICMVLFLALIGTCSRSNENKNVKESHNAEQLDDINNLKS